MVAALPAKPTAFSLSGLSRIGLPLKNGSSSTPLKRTITALDDEEASDRKLQKLDLPDVNPEVQSGEAAQVDAIGDDLAVADGDDAVEEDVKPDIIPEVKPSINGDSNSDIKMQIDRKEGEDDDVDPLDAYMLDIGTEVKQVNQSDAKRMGLMEQDHDSENEDEVKNKAEEELTKAEALLQYGSLRRVRVMADVQYRMAASKSRKKDLPTPDHSKIEYEPFRKAFYSAPVEVLEMDEEETELMRLEMDGIKIRGQDAPRPVKHWGAFGLPTVW